MANYVKLFGGKLRNFIKLQNFNSPTKAIIIILLWQFVNNFDYFLYLKASVVIRRSNRKTAIIIILMEAIISIFSPLAGFLADVVYGRLQVLKFSAYANSVCTIGALLMVTIQSSGKMGVVAWIGFTISIIGCYLSRVLFVTNIIQFGTDQLRDLPTRKSVFYIHIYFWSRALTFLFTGFVSSFTHPLTFHNINTHTPTVVTLEICLSFSAVFLIGIVFVIDKSAHIFLDDKLTINPYKLVYNVINFAIKHKKPLRRSAFTYCEDERPSRIDNGKQRYGGPFTTEQVEDVKVLLNIVLVIISLGPVFLLDFNVETFYGYFLRSHLIQHNISSYTATKIDILTPSVIIFCIPFFHLFVKPCFSRVIPGMLKRMGLSILILIIIFSISFVIDTIAYDYNFHEDTVNCFGSNRSIFNKPLVHVPVVVIPIVIQMLYGLYLMLIYISILEFISCQSPQYMKGILFGLLYCIRSVFQLLSTIMSYFFFSNNRLSIDAPHLKCKLVYFATNLLIGFIGLIIFTVISRRYKYRRRDDICNVYQYAEDYYSGQ